MKNDSPVLKITSNLEINNWKDETVDFSKIEMSSHSNSQRNSANCNTVAETSRMFGSSPTLLNCNPKSFNVQPLDSVPVQYRRGYTNLNDPCLSSSTSNLECLRAQAQLDSSSMVNRKKSAKGNRRDRFIYQMGETEKSGNRDIMSLRHRGSSTLDFVRSYENLDRAKIIRAKNHEKQHSVADSYGYLRSSCNPSLNCIGNSKTQTDQIDGHCSEGNSSDDLSYSNLGFDAYPSNYQSNESLFNINFDTIDDDVFEIDTMGLFENDLSTTQSQLLLNEKFTSSTKNDATGTGSRKKVFGKIKSLSDLPQSPSSNSQMPSYHFDTNDLVTLSDQIKVPTVTSFAGREFGQICSSIAEPTKTKDKSHELIALARNTIGQSNPISDTSQTSPTLKKKLRCAQCNKKLGVIMIMKCHCEQVFCSQHRYAEAHNCSYNFKAEGQRIIARENPLVIASKLPKI